MPADRDSKPQTAKATAAIRRLQKEMLYLALVRPCTAGELRARFARDGDRRHVGAAFKALVRAGVLATFATGSSPRGPKRWHAVEGRAREFAAELRAAERAG